MDWRPENEVDEDEKQQALRLMQRDEAMAIVMTMVEAQIEKGIDTARAVDVAIEQAPKIMDFLNGQFKV
jgi:hypothetical protein